MPIDKKWIEIADRRKIEYVGGVDEFLNFAFQHSAVNEKIKCLCTKCRNTSYGCRDDVRFHLLKEGFLKSYTLWYFHGEYNGDSSSEDCYEDGAEEPQFNDMVGLLNDIYGTSNINGCTTGEQSGDSNSHDFVNGDEPNPGAALFYRLLSEAKEKVHPTCEHSKLGAIVKLLQLKSSNKWTNRSFDGLLELLRDLVPDGKEKFPAMYREARSYISDLGLHYEKYDVCENNCTLYWGPDVEATSCRVCGLSRWKNGEKENEGKPVPHKVLRYFPLTPRLQRLYMSTKTASDMRWHKEGRVDDGDLHHPRDTPAWKHFDNKHKSFAREKRNVKFGIGADGFQPFGNMSSQHSIWPVVLIPYNLPPWMCMKQPYFMMSMIIPGPHCPGMGIDVFLQPLIAELKVLWDGVETFDVHEKENFKLRAAVLWTISDFPGYADLSGYSTRGYLACPSCHRYTTSKYLPASRKICYLGTRKFLPKNHKWRKDKFSFDGTEEKQAKPEPLRGNEIVDEVNSFKQLPFGRGIKRKYDASNSLHNWRKKSIFFELPYWETLLIRHNLDVMHIAKNVCDNCVGTIFNIAGKSKDTLSSRYDLVSMGIRSKLHPFQEGNKVKVPVSSFSLSNKEKEAVCKMLEDLKTPDGYLSKISRCVNVKERKISGMKSHDCHVFLQRLLPLAIRGFLPKDVCEPLVELSAFFRDLCSKSLNPSDLDRMETQIVLTLCKLEMIFPPSFFDIMVHLCLHLPGEAKIAGPVHFRWMYPVERYLRTLKSYVRNKAHPEGSIAEAYIADECLTFCSRYLDGIDTKFNRPPRNDDNLGDSDSDEGSQIFPIVGRPFGKVSHDLMDRDTRERAHLYVLNNTEDVWPFIEEFKKSLPKMRRSELKRRYNAEFATWFHERVVEMHSRGEVSDHLLYLAQRPLTRYKTYSGFIVNGYRFHTVNREEARKTQNSGVLCRGNAESTDKEYYGSLEEVWELEYVGRNKVHLFKYDWFDVDNKSLGCKVENYAITSVNKNRRLKTDEPFILVSQAEQVFYVEDPKDSNWSVVMKAPPRGVWDMPATPDLNDVDEMDEVEALQDETYDPHARATSALDSNDGCPDLERVDVDPDEVTLEVAQKFKNHLHSVDASVDDEETEYYGEALYDSEEDEYEDD